MKVRSLPIDIARATRPGEGVDHKVVSSLSKSMLLPVPLKMLRIRTEAGVLVEVQRAFVKGRKEAAVG